MSILFSSRYLNYPSHPFPDRRQARTIWREWSIGGKPTKLDKQPATRPTISANLIIFEDLPDSSHLLSERTVTLDLIDHFLLCLGTAKQTDDHPFLYSDTILFTPIGNCRTSYTFEYQNTYHAFLLRSLRKDLFYNSRTGLLYLRNYPRDGQPHRYKVNTQQELIIT